MKTSRNQKVNTVRVFVNGRSITDDEEKKHGEFNSRLPWFRLAVDVRHVFLLGHPLPQSSARGPPAGGGLWLGGEEGGPGVAGGGNWGGKGKGIQLQF